MTPMSSLCSSRSVAKLAAYLGHAHVSDTYWYLSATPELLALAARRLEPDHLGEVQP